MRSLEPWDDARACLGALRESGHALVALSNSSADTIRALLDGAGIAPLFESIVSADEVRRPKPDFPKPDLIAGLDLQGDESFTVTTI